MLCRDMQHPVARPGLPAQEIGQRVAGGMDFALAPSCRDTGAAQAGLVTAEPWGHTSAMQGWLLVASRPGLPLSLPKYEQTPKTWWWGTCASPSRMAPSVSPRSLPEVFCGMWGTPSSSPKGQW